MWIEKVCDVPDEAASFDLVVRRYKKSLFKLDRRGDQRNNTLGGNGARVGQGGPRTAATWDPF